MGPKKLDQKSTNGAIKRSMLLKNRPLEIKLPCETLESKSTNIERLNKLCRLRSKLCEVPMILSDIPWTKWKTDIEEKSMIIRIKSRTCKISLKSSRHRWLISFDNIKSL